MLSRNAVGNLIKRYSAVLKKCAFINACVLSLAMGTIGVQVAQATDFTLTKNTTYDYTIEGDSGVTFISGSDTSIDAEYYLYNTYGSTYVLNSEEHSLTLNAGTPDIFFDDPNFPNPWGSLTLGALVCDVETYNHSETTYEGASLSLSVNNTKGVDTYGYLIWEYGRLNLNSKETIIQVTSDAEGYTAAGIGVVSYVPSLYVGNPDIYTDKLLINVDAPLSEAVALDVQGTADTDVSIYTKEVTLTAQNATAKQGATALRVHGPSSVTVDADMLTLSATNKTLSASELSSNVCGIDMMATVNGTPNVALFGNTTITLNEGNIPSGASNAQAIRLEGGDFYLNPDNTTEFTKITGDVIISEKDDNNPQVRPARAFATIGLYTQDSFLKGNLDVNDAAEAHLQFDNGAIWTGYATNNGSEELISHISLQRDARWNVTGDSDITHLDIADSTVDLSQSPKMIRLEIDDLQGQNGVFVLKADLANDLADQVHIENTEQVTHTLRVVSTGASGADVEAMDTYLVRHEDSNATFKLDGDKIDRGAYIYVLESRTVEGAPQEQAPAAQVQDPAAQAQAQAPAVRTRAMLPTGAAVAPTGAAVDPTGAVVAPTGAVVDPTGAEIDPTQADADDTATEWFLKRQTGDGVGGPGTQGTPVLSPSAELVLGLSGMSTAYSMWMTQLSDIRERSGEFRRAGVNGFWMRTSAQEDEVSGINGIDFDQELYNVSMGYDRCIVDDTDKKFTVGMQAQLGYAEQEVQGHYGASGDNTTFGFSAYATLAYDSGAFFDFVGTWNYYEQNLKTRMLDNTSVSGNYDNFGLGLSVEGGYSFDVGNNIFIEPQAQFSYYRLQSVDYTLSNDMAVKHDAIDSATGRLGVVVGKNWDNGLEAYLKLGVNHVLAASQSVYINDERFSGDLDGTRVYYGLGLDWQINETTSLYGELEREDGEHFTKKWGANFGVKFEF